jgi:hypothetical protein
MARGGQAALAEVCEQLAWLGAALRPSPVSSGICFASSSITATRDTHLSSAVPSVTVQMNFPITPAPDRMLSMEGTCWHAMFRNPVVASGFPILARHEDERGLELPFDVMSLLAETQHATSYNATLILKGLCTMLIPTRQTKHSITWHFVYNENGKRIPYYSFRERCPDWISIDKVSADLVEIGNVRNFVGWASDITRHLGTSAILIDYHSRDLQLRQARKISTTIKSTGPELENAQQEWL